MGEFPEVIILGSEVFKTHYKLGSLLNVLTKRMQNIVNGTEQQQLSSDETSDSCGMSEPGARGSPKSWSQKDMDKALDALKNHNMSLTKVPTLLPMLHLTISCT